jgi:N-acetylmuramoyl-L-alanine amidase
MASIDETRARLLRGIVQDNLSTRPDKRIAQEASSETRQRFWLWSIMVGVITTSLTVFLSVIPRANTPALNAAPAVTRVMPVAADPFSDPRPLVRGAIPLSIKTIVIDPGHGGEPGTIAESGLMEKDVTLDIALRLRRILEDAPFRVLLTREADRPLSLDKRVTFANENSADLLVSIHANSMEPHSIRGIETFYVGPSDDPATLTLASRENRDSGYSLSDYKKILEKIYGDVRRDESRTLAHTIQSHLFRSLRTSNPQLENRGVKTAPFVVLVGTQMPAILVEIACLSNQDEAALLSTDAYRESIALALAKGIRSYAHGLRLADWKGA